MGLDGLDGLDGSLGLVEYRAPYDAKGSHQKKNCYFFFTFSQKTETPPPPFLTTSVFSDKDFLDWRYKQRCSLIWSVYFIGVVGTWFSD